MGRKEALSGTGVWHLEDGEARGCEELKCDSGKFQTYL